MELLLKYFPRISPEQLELFAQLEVGIRFWNRKINLVSRKETDHLEERHILHSLAIARYAVFSPGEKVLDIGTGGGFPGLPLAILFPDVSFCLIDSIGKKVRAVEEMISGMGLKNVECMQIRAEDFKGMSDHIVSRAVTSMGRFSEWSRDKLILHEEQPERNGMWYLKGGDLSAELGPFPEARIYELNRQFEEEYFLTKKLVFLPAGNLVSI